MPRSYIDCREFLKQERCSVSIAADSQQELLDAAVEHAVSVHHLKDSEQLRQEVRTRMRIEDAGVQ